MLPEFNGQIIGKYNQPESCVLIGQQFSGCYLSYKNQCFRHQSSTTGTGVSSHLSRSLI